MTVVANPFNGWVPEALNTQLPGGATVPQQANTQSGQGQPVYFDASGNVAPNDGTVPGLVCAGVTFPEKITALSPVAGASSLLVHQGIGGQVPASTLAGDGFTAADQCVPVWDAGGGTPGRLSNTGPTGSNRPLMGLCLGVYRETGNPRIWIGPEAQAVARAVHALNAESAGTYTYAADATASTDLGSITGSALTTIGFLMNRTRRHGVITSVEIIPSAALALALTNYRVIQIWKLDTTGTVALASSPLVATFSTLTQNLVAGQPTQFTLATGTALNLIETDLLVGTSIHTASGATVPLSIIRANMKVI